MFQYRSRTLTSNIFLFSTTWEFATTSKPGPHAQPGFRYQDVEGAIVREMTEGQRSGVTDHISHVSPLKQRGHIPQGLLGDFK